MFAVCAAKPNPDDPLASLVVGERPEPEIPDGWVRVKISHASLNRHDLFTLRGITAQPDPISFPMILGNDGAGTLEDGTPVVIYPVMGSDDWRDDETLDPRWHILSERAAGTFADYVAVPSRKCDTCGSSQLDPRELVDGFDGLAVACKRWGPRQAHHSRRPQAANREPSLRCCWNRSRRAIKSPCSSVAELVARAFDFGIDCFGF